jgi:hypothetical protein
MIECSFWIWKVVIVEQGFCEGDWLFLFVVVVVVIITIDPVIPIVVSVF